MYRDRPRTLVVMSQVRSVFCLDLCRVFLQGDNMPLLKPRIFLDLSLGWEGDIASVHYAFAST